MCDIKQTLSFLAFPLITKGHTGCSKAAAGRNQGSSAPDSNTPSTGNTERRVSPSLRNSPWELQEHRTHSSNVDKKATKGSTSNPLKSTRSCCVPEQGHSSRQQWKWLSDPLCPLDARGRSFPSPRRAHRDPSAQGFPGSCSPAPQPDPS